ARPRRPLILLLVLFFARLDAPHAITTSARPSDSCSRLPAADQPDRRSPTTTERTSASACATTSVNTATQTACCPRAARSSAGDGGVTISTVCPVLAANGSKPSACSRAASPGESCSGRYGSDTTTAVTRPSARLWVSTLAVREFSTSYTYNSRTSTFTSTASGNASNSPMNPNSDAATNCALNTTPAGILICRVIMRGMIRLL